MKGDDDKAPTAEPRAKVKVHPKVSAILRPFADSDAKTIQRLRRRNAQDLDDGSDELFDNLPV